MDMINKFFSNLAEMLDSEIDAAVAAVEVEGILAKARFRAAVKKAGNEFRRLKMALGLEADSVALKIETVGLLSDSEIVQKFFSLTEDDQSDLVVGLEEGFGSRGPRLLEMIQTKIDADAAQAEAEAKAKAEEEEKATAAQVRRYALEHPEDLVNAGIPLDDEQALAYIRIQPNGYFRTVAELKDLEREVDGVCMVRSMYSGAMIPATEAKVLRLCFICEEAVANRLRKQLGKAERYHHWDETERWLAARETEAAERQTAQDALVTEISAALSESAACTNGAAVYDHVSLALVLDRFLSAKAESGQPVEGWQERVIGQIYDSFVEKARFVFVGRLREQFSTVGSDLDAYIVQCQTAVAEAKSNGSSEQVRRAVIAQLRCALTHKDWLAAHPPRQQAAVAKNSFDSSRPVVRHTGKTARSKANGEDPEAKKAAKREADRAYREAHKGKGGGGDTRRGQPKKGKGSNKNAA